MLPILAAVTNPLSIGCLVLLIAATVAIFVRMRPRPATHRYAVAVFVFVVGLILITAVVVGIPGASAGGAGRLASCTADVSEPLRNSVRYLLSAESLLNIGVFAVPAIAVGLLPRGWRIPAAVGLMLLSPAIEAAQAMLGTRACTWADVVHNTEGVLLGLGLGAPFGHSSRRKSTTTTTNSSRQQETGVTSRRSTEGLSTDRREQP